MVLCSEILGAESRCISIYESHLFKFVLLIKLGILDPEN